MLFESAKNILLLVRPHISSPFVNLSWWYKSRIIPEGTIMISTRNSYVFINQKLSLWNYWNDNALQVNVFVINMQVRYGRSWVSNYISLIVIIYTRPKISMVLIGSIYLDARLSTVLYTQHTHLIFYVMNCNRCQLKPWRRIKQFMM